MAILRALNEFFYESVVLALEPSRKCICNCTYCFAELNSRAQVKGRQKNYNDNSSFESTVSRAFSPSYDPSHFLQWALVNKMVLGFANTVEPFQDSTQANGILQTLDKFGIPLLVQTKGVNFDLVWDRLKNFRDNANLFVSLPTTNQAIAKRFEPGTPPIVDRLAMIERAALAGFHVTLALSPYHEDWTDDPESMIRHIHSLGISSVFFDRLHLNKRQRQTATDRVMVELADNTESSEWSEKCIDHYRIIYETCDDLNIPIFASSMIPVLYGYCNTIPTISPPGIYKRGFEWPYNDGMIHSIFHELFYGDPEYDPSNRDENDSIIFTWQDALKIMELESSVAQEFSWSSLRDLICIKSIPASWQRVLKPAATIQSYYRALWNSPSRSQFVWRHPWAKIAKKPDGSPWIDQDGNAIMIVDPDYRGTGKDRIVEDLDIYRSIGNG